MWRHLLFVRVRDVGTEKGWGESKKADWDKMVKKARVVVCFRGAYVELWS